MFAPACIRGPRPLFAESRARVGQKPTNPRRHRVRDEGGTGKLPPDGACRRQCPYTAEHSSAWRRSARLARTSIPQARDEETAACCTTSEARHRPDHQQAGAAHARTRVIKRTPHILRLFWPAYGAHRRMARQITSRRRWLPDASHGALRSARILAWPTWSRPEQKPLRAGWMPRRSAKPCGRRRRGVSSRVLDVLKPVSTSLTSPAPARLPACRVSPSSASTEPRDHGGPGDRSDQ